MRPLMAPSAARPFSILQPKGRSSRTRSSHRLSLAGKERAEACSVSTAAVVKPFMAVVRRRGFAPFAWYRIVLGVVLLAALAAGWGF